ncbi:MAG: hypothetical protein WA364_25910 [Candidatus Nitrosopolaris sp.]
MVFIDKGNGGCHANHSITTPVAFVGNASNSSCERRVIQIQSCRPSEIGEKRP